MYLGYIAFFPATGHCAWTPDQCSATPSLPWALLSLVVFSLVFELGFYTSHFLMHQKPFYRLIHKTHHRFKSRTLRSATRTTSMLNSHRTHFTAVALAAKYAHPLEHVVSNLLPIIAGPVLMHAHPILQFAWTSMGIFQVCVPQQRPLVTVSAVQLFLLRRADMHLAQRLPTLCLAAKRCGTRLAPRSDSRVLRHSGAVGWPIQHQHTVLGASCALSSSAHRGGGRP
jgi:hypothetical protein